MIVSSHDFSHAQALPVLLLLRYCLVAEDYCTEAAQNVTCVSAHLVIVHWCSIQLQVPTEKHTLCLRLFPVKLCFSPLYPLVIFRSRAMPVC